MKKCKKVFWNKKKCCLCLPVSTATKYFVVCDLLFVLLWSVYYVLFLFLDSQNLSEWQLSFYSFLAPFLKQGDSKEDREYNYNVLRNLLILYVMVYILVIYKLYLGFKSWVNSFSVRTLELYYRATFAYVYYSILINFIITCMQFNLKLFYYFPFNLLNCLWFLPNIRHFLENQKEFQYKKLKMHKYEHRITQQIVQNRRHSHLRSRSSSTTDILNRSSIFKKRPNTVLMDSQKVMGEPVDDQPMIKQLSQIQEHVAEELKTESNHKRSTKTSKQTLQ